MKIIDMKDVGRKKKKKNRQQRKSAGEKKNARGRGGGREGKRGEGGGGGGGGLPKAEESEGNACRQAPCFWKSERGVRNGSVWRGWAGAVGQLPFWLAWINLQKKCQFAVLQKISCSKTQYFSRASLTTANVFEAVPPTASIEHLNKIQNVSSEYFSCGRLILISPQTLTSSLHGEF